VYADRGGALVELEDRAVNAVQVAGAGVVVDPHAVADVQRRERGHAAQGVQQVLSCVDRAGERWEVEVEPAVGDLLEQQLLGLGRSRRLAAGGSWRGEAGGPLLLASAGAFAHAVRIAGAPD
jgi:hypothetical protein